MARLLTVAALQAAYGADLEANLNKTERLIREAAGRGAQVILPSELFEGPYFCTSQEERWFSQARGVDEHPALLRLAPLAKELGVVLPLSFFEKDGPAYYNSIAVYDADGARLGVYRKSHIPDGPGYQEKYYFRPGDTGFKVWRTKFATIGVGICWDQWFPEAARAMALAGAEALFYPTAIGSEPHDSSLDTRDPWRRAMQGHAVSNVMPVIASNRIGTEASGQRFHGSSFICDHRGDLVASLERTEEGVLTHTFDLDFLTKHRAAWGFFRDRRPELYR